MNKQASFNNKNSNLLQIRNIEMFNDKKLENFLTITQYLIAEQFPHWAHLPIKPVKPGGLDNKTFHLATDMLIRLPSAKEYAPQVQKEHTWLPLLASHLSIPIPEPIAMGNPSKDYPYHWSIYRWIDGKSADTLFIHHIDLQQLAMQLALFLNELHKINPTGGPLPGPYNFYRGGSLLIYDAETRLAIAQLQELIDSKAATAVWQKAISSEWNKKPVWIHGDLSAGNILIKDNRLAAIIDFGLMAIGDPACDLIIAWTLLKKESRQLFKNHLHLDSDTWDRARGWALWKALITLSSLKDKACKESIKQLFIINEILSDNEDL